MTAATILLRPATDRDAREIVELLANAGLDAAFDPREFVVAQESEHVVAAARLRALPDGAHELASVVVAPHLRRTGVGARIVREALDRATGAVFALAVAPEFFEKLGFARLDDVPAVLAERATTTCAGTSFTPMAWHASRERAVASIQRHYGALAVASASCCGTDVDSHESSCCPRDRTYDESELASLPDDARFSLGTGNPVRAAAPQPGETTLDLGSGGGVDTFLAARAVGPHGRAFGVDFTPEMVARARASAEKAGVSNVAFHLAPIERLPLGDESVDVITSNCVINLSTDKPAVLRESLRVLRRGGRFVVSDTLRVAATPMSQQPSCDCVTGAMTADEWRDALVSAGFVDVDIEPTAEDGASVGRVLVRARKA